jgi:hypothetical protein
MALREIEATSSPTSTRRAASTGGPPVHEALHARASFTLALDALRHRLD